MFPAVEVNSHLEETTFKNTFGKTYLFDFETGEFVMKDGKLVIASEIEAIQMWVTKIILTEKFKFKIYEKEVDQKNQEYGVTFKSLIGLKLPKEMIYSEISRELGETLKKHPQIDKISGLEIKSEGGKYTIEFMIHLVNSDEVPSEVINIEQ